jgi:hypothetical protein
MFRGLIGVAYRPHLAWAHLAFMAVGALAIAEAFMRRR